MPSPTTMPNRRETPMARLRAADAYARWMRQRRQAAIRNGMRRDTPLTREELAARCAQAAR